VDHTADASFSPELQRTGVEVAGLTFVRHTYDRRHQCLPSLSTGRCAFCFERQRVHGQRICPPTHSAHLPLCCCSHCRPPQLTGARQGEPNTHTTVLWATALSPSLLRPSDYWASLHGLTVLIGRPAVLLSDCLFTKGQLVSGVIRDSSMLDPNQCLFVHAIAGFFMRASGTSLLHGLDQPTADVRDLG
jgi:hypothetical protein